MKTIFVQFIDGTNRKDYAYAVEDSEVIEAGDFAVVHNGNDYRIVEVNSVAAGIDGRVNKTIVCVLNNATREDYEKRNAEITARKSLFQKLDQLLAKESIMTKYRQLAQYNNEAAEILKQLESN